MDSSYLVYYDDDDIARRRQMYYNCSCALYFFTLMTGFGFICFCFYSMIVGDPSKYNIISISMSAFFVIVCFIIGISCVIQVCYQPPRYQEFIL